MSVYQTNARTILEALRALYVLRHGSKRKWRYWASRRLGVSLSTLGLWFAGIQRPNRRNLRKLEDFLGTERSLIT